MASILLFRDDEKAIDENLFIDALTSMKGVSNLERGTLDGARVRCHYTLGESSVLVELDDESESIDISDMGSAALDFAIGLQARFSEALRIIDESYSFDLQLKDYRSAADLDAGIDAALAQEDD